MSITDKIADLVDEFGEETIAINTSAGAAVKVTLRKPRPNEWFRASNLPSHVTGRSFRVYEDEGARTSYLVVPSPELLATTLGSLAKPRKMVICTNRDGQTFISPVGLLADNAWHQSSREAHDLAIKTWTLMRSGKQQGLEKYTVSTSKDIKDVPVFRQDSLSDLLNEAFHGCIIRDVDHIEVRKLEGLA